jgi:predicted phage terminase large subunit-like protein
MSTKKPASSTKTSARNSPATSRSTRRATAPSLGTASTSTRPTPSKRTGKPTTPVQKTSSRTTSAAKPASPKARQGTPPATTPVSPRAKPPAAGGQSPTHKTLAQASKPPSPTSQQSSTPLGPAPKKSPASSTHAQAPSNPQLAAAQLEIAQRVLCKRRLIPFTKRINPKYDAGWVHNDIARRLERFSDDVAKGLSPRLMLLMPPRHGKSELASRMFPAWHLGRHPDHEIIACSYNVSLAMTFSKKVKEVLEDPSYQNVFSTRLHPDNRSAEEWTVHNQRGGYVAAGVGGGITGKGAHVLIIDDPIKNAQEADSADVRETLWDWYGSTAYTRLAPGGGVLVIQTWWHDDDLAGRLQISAKEDEEADQFEVVKYPAIAEDDEYLELATDQIVYGTAIGDELAALHASERVALELTGSCTSHRRLRHKGDALHPARYDTIKLQRIKKNLQPRHWSALYQQNPVPDDGAYFTKDQFRRAGVPNIKGANVFVAFDFAITEKKQNDYTVGTVGLQDDNDVLHVAEVIRFKSADAFFIVESILDLCKRWYSPTLMLGLEDGQIYKAMSSLLAKRMRERRMNPPITLLTPITDKMARARPLQGRMQQGMVSFNLAGDWYDVVRQEMLRFPAGVHDDCVDSLAWMAHMAINRQPPRKPKSQEPKSWRDKLAGMGIGSTSHMAA